MPSTFSELVTFAALWGMALSNFPGGANSEAELQRAQGSSSAQGTSLQFLGMEFHMRNFTL